MGGAKNKDEQDAERQVGKLQDELRSREAEEAKKDDADKAAVAEKSRKEQDAEQQAGKLQDELRSREAHDAKKDDAAKAALAEESKKEQEESRKEHVAEQQVGKLQDELRSREAEETKKDDVAKATKQQAQRKVMACTCIFVACFAILCAMTIMIFRLQKSQDEHVRSYYQKQKSCDAKRVRLESYGRTANEILKKMGGLKGSVQKSCDEKKVSLATWFGLFENPREDEEILEKLNGVEGLVAPLVCNDKLQGA